jgi:hypothetical protein
LIIVGSKSSEQSALKLNVTLFSNPLVYFTHQTIKRRHVENEYQEAVDLTIPNLKFREDNERVS